MSLTNKIAQHTIFRVVGRGLGLIAGVLIVGLLTRYLGQDGYGRYTASVAFLQFFAIVADFGFYQIAMQMIADPRADESKIVNNIFSLRFWFALIVLALACGIGFLIPSYSTEIKLGICIASLAIFFVLLNQILVAVYQKYIQMAGVSAVEFFGKILNLVLIILAIHYDFGIYATFLALVIANGFVFIANLINLRKLIKIRFEFDFALWKKVFIKSWPLGLSIIFSMLYFKMDTIVLSIFRPESEVGIYGASYQLVEVLNSFPALFVGLIMPILSQAWVTKNKEYFKEILQKAFDFILIIAVPLVCGGFVLADKIILLIAGDDFASAGVVLKILIFAIGFLFVGQLFGHAIVAIEKQKKMMWNYLLVAILGVSAYFVLIPRFSYYAAASITIVTEFLIAVLSMQIVFTELESRLKINILWKVVLSSLLMSLVVWRFQNLHVLISVALGGVVYLFLMLAFRGITKNQLLEILKYKK